MNNQIPLYVLNSFLKFERKLYSIGNLSLGRPIKIKTLLYAMFFGVIEILIYFTPIIGRLINWMPFVFLLLIPMALAWLLSDIGTEDRSPISYFKSFITYQIRKVIGNTYFRNRVIEKERNYSFNNYYTFKGVPEVVTQDEIDRELFAMNERRKALTYKERIVNPDEFFKRKKEEEIRKALEKKLTYRIKMKINNLFRKGA